MKKAPPRGSVDKIKARRCGENQDQVSAENRNTRSHSATGLLSLWLRSLDRFGVGKMSRLAAVVKRNERKVTGMIGRPQRCLDLLRWLVCSSR
jgi:hypothetical protein